MQKCFLFLEIVRISVQGLKIGPRGSKEVHLNITHLT